MWAYGISLYIYLTNAPPFLKNGEKPKDKQEFGNLLNTINIAEYISKKYEEMGFSKELIDFQTKLLKVNPQERPSFKNIIEDDWFKGYEEYDPEQEE